MEEEILPGLEETKLPIIDANPSVSQDRVQPSGLEATLPESNAPGDQTNSSAYQAPTSEDSSSSANVYVPSEEDRLQQRYIKALVRMNPGLGPKSEKFAEALVSTGLKPTQALMFVRAVYSPKDIEGKGQATRLKYFSEALIRRYGDCTLENARQHEKYFLSLLADVSAATNMRDEINEFLEGEASISFANILLLQEVGLNQDSFLDYVEVLAKQPRMNRLKAVLRVVEAAESIREHNAGNLEALLFSGDFEDWEIGSDEE